MAISAGLSIRGRHCVPKTSEPSKLRSFDFLLSEGVSCAAFTSAEADNDVLSNAAADTATTTASEIVPIDYRFTSNLSTDPPGAYSIALIFTVVEN
jgi:hypothetical protein